MWSVAFSSRELELYIVQGGVLTPFNISLDKCLDRKRNCPSLGTVGASVPILPVQFALAKRDKQILNSF